MFISLNNSPENRKGKSLEYQINKRGIIDGKLFHEDLIRRSRLSSKRCVEYWISKGFTEEEASAKISDVQRTFSLDICIKKHGKEKGYNIWKARQEKWQRTLNSKTKDEIFEINQKKNMFSVDNYIRRGYSLNEAIDKIKKRIDTKQNKYYSEECINFLLNNIILDDSFYGDREYFLYDTTNQKIYFYDFTNVNKKLILEYHGEAFHPNKKILSEEQFNIWKHPYNKHSAQDQYDIDRKKRILAESKGFKVFEVYSNDPFDLKVEIISQINSILSS